MVNSAQNSIRKSSVNSALPLPEQASGVPPFDPEMVYHKGGMELEEGSQEASHGTLVSGSYSAANQERMKIAEEIGKAVQSGNLKELHKLHHEFNALDEKCRLLALQAPSEPMAGGIHELPLPQPAKTALLPDNPPLKPIKELPLPGSMQAPHFSKQADASSPSIHTDLPAISDSHSSAPAAVKSDPIKPAEKLPLVSAEPAAQASPAQTSSDLHIKELPLPLAADTVSTSPQTTITAPSQTVPSQSLGSGNPYGVSESVWGNACRSSQIKEALLNMPEKAVNLFKQMTPQEKQEMVKRLSGTTHIFFSTIDNRQAFISGQAMGQDTFSYLKHQIDKEMENGKISMDEGVKQEAAFHILKSLTPLQREGFADLVEADTSRVF